MRRHPGVFDCVYFDTRRLPKHLILILLCITAWLAALSHAYCGGGPRNVLVVVNSRSEISREIGLYYQKARKIPQENMLTLSCSTNEFVSKNECETRIREPIRRYLQSPEMAGKIDYIVLTKGIPLGAYYENNNSYSTASVLMCADHPEILGPLISPYGPSAKSYWPNPAPECAWKHSLEFIKNSKIYHFYLVTRLDAYTVDQVKQLIDKSIRPALDGRFLLDKLPSQTGYYAYANDRLGVGEGSAYNILANSGHEAVCDSTSVFVGSKTGLMGYFSWGKNDPDYTYNKYMSNSFVPGSIADLYYSFSARTLVKPPDPPNPDDRSRESLIGDLIERGVCGVGGYVSEPVISTTTYPNILFDRYTKGYNLAESFYMACPELFWKTVVVGDPLMAPFATPPQVSLSGVDLPVTGTVQIAANANDESGVSRVDFYLDGTLVASDTLAPFVLTLDTTLYSVGEHILEAVAFENTAVATEASVSAPLYIQNEVSVITHSSQALGYPDGQQVKLTGKLVVAGNDTVAGGFYIEEADRSFGIKVKWNKPISSGDVVDITGPVTTLNGVRFIEASQVIVTASGNPLPKPLMIQIKCSGGSSFSTFTPGVSGANGLRNVGLLVKVIGTVASSTGSEFVITDGSGSVLTVVKPPGCEVTIGAQIAVTGIMDLVSGSSGLYPRLLVKGPEQVALLGP